jgi:hypothetical protein
MPVIKHVPRHRTNPQSMWLSGFAANITSQFGEDGIIEKIFKIVPPQNKWCVEFGAWDGKHLSNTWTLINNHHWSGVLIEGNGCKAADLAAGYVDRKNDVFIENDYVGWDGESALDKILARTPIPKQPDLMSIDIDGNDWHVWKALNGYRPTVVVIEYNPTASNEMYFVQDPDISLNQGCSLLALVELGKEKAYELIATTATNGIFISAEFYPLIGIEDNSLDAIHPEILRTEICHGYDGTIIAAGHMMLNWH